MPLSPGMLKDVGLDFCSGKLSEKEYERRRDACTRKHLNELMSSSAYKDWLEKANPARKASSTLGDILLAAVIVAVAAVIVAQPLFTTRELGSAQGATHVPPTATASTRTFTPIHEHLGSLFEEFQSTGNGLEKVEAALGETKSALQDLISVHTMAEQSVLRTEAKLKGLELNLDVLSNEDPTEDLSATEGEVIPMKGRVRLQANMQIAAVALIISGILSALAVGTLLHAIYEKKRLILVLRESLLRVYRSIKKCSSIQDAAQAEAHTEGSQGSAHGLEMTRGALDAELKTLQDEVSRIVCSSSGEIKLLRTELMAAEEERAAEASQHDRELAHLERQLADEVSRKEATAQQAKRWLDQAQGQLQNTQTALTVKEVEVKELSAQLDQAAADYARLRESLAKYVEDAAAAEGLRKELAEKDEECARLSMQLAEAHDNLATLHLEAQEAATHARLEAEEAVTGRDQRVLELTAEVEILQNEITTLRADLFDAKAEALQLQEELRHRVEECERISAQLRDHSEQRTACAISADDCSVETEGREHASEIGKVAHLEAALERERAATEIIQRELSAANTTVAQLQDLIAAAKTREAQLVSSTQNAGRQVGSVMQMMKNTRVSLERKINASQGLCALESDLAANRGQENRPLEEMEPVEQCGTGQPRTPLQPLQVQRLGQPIVPSTDETPLLMKGYPAPAVAARLKTAARSPYWFAKG